MRISFLSLFLVVGLFMPVEAQEKFLLTSNVPPGKYVSTVQMKFELTMQLADGRGRKIEASNEYDIAQEYLPENEDGTKSLRFHTERFKLRLVGDNKQVFIDFDSEREENDPDCEKIFDALLESRFEFTLDSDGTILSGNGFDEFSKKLESIETTKFPGLVEQYRSGYRKQMEDLVSNDRYLVSKEPVGVGDSWKFETTQSDPSRGTFLMKSTARFDSLEEKPGEDPVVVIKTVTRGTQEEPASTITRNGTSTTSDGKVRIEAIFRRNTRDSRLLSMKSTTTRTGKYTLKSFDPNLSEISSIDKETGKTTTTVKRLP